MYSKVCKSIRLHLDVPKCIRMYSDASKVFHSFFFGEGFWEGQKSLRKYAFPALLFSARLTAKRPVSPISWAPHK